MDGLRYLLTRYYLQLGDYKGELAYTRWFANAFPDDVGSPDFLFDWSVLLFKMGKLAQAQAKVGQTYCANTYVLDKFFGKPVEPLPEYEWSNRAMPGFTDYFTYSHQQADMVDFAQRLGAFMASDRFVSGQARYLAIHQRLAVEEDREIRGYLLQEAHQFENVFNVSV